MPARNEKKIDRLAATDRKRFLTEFRLRQPVVLRDALTSWPGTLFDMGQLAARFGTVPLMTYSLPPGTAALRMSSIKRDFHYWTDKGGNRKHLRRWTFGEFLVSLNNGGAHYCMANGTKNTRLRDRLAAETGRFEILTLAAAKPNPVHCEFFFGSENTGPGLHHDGAVESFLCQLIGTKRVNVFSPSNVTYLYPAGSWLAPRSHFSIVADSFNADRRKFPLFRLATVNSCQLDPGDVLYLPPHWYHDPCAQGPSAMMTIRNSPPLEVWGTARKRDKLTKAASVLYQCLNELSPTARAIYFALLSHDLANGLHARDQKGKLPKSS